VLGPILLKLNDAGTVYAARTTFEPIENGVALQPNATEAMNMTPYANQDMPSKPGNYRLLTVDKEKGQTVNGLDDGDYLLNESGQAVYKVRHNFPEELRADPSKLGGMEKLQGPQAQTDPKEYRVFQKTDDAGGPAGRYLVDANGVPVYLVDPGINGVQKVRPDGSAVDKFKAPKATLMSYIIKGILDRKLPWGLVLLGVMIAIVLEMSGIPSLAFAVGVYLPLSSSSPIFIGGMIRWLADSYLRKKHKGKNLTEEELTAEGDKSPGVLLASGYIAGGALAGIVIAFMAGVLKDKTDRIEAWSKVSNPFFGGAWADLLSLIPFLLLMILLYLVGREVFFAGRPKRAKT
jgi:hypothetical protein